MEPITLSQREYVSLLAGHEVSDEEIREFVVEYEDWLYSCENIGGYDEAESFEAQPGG